LVTKEIELSICPICNNRHFQSYKLGLVQCKDCDVILSPSVWQPSSNEEMETEWFGEAYHAQPSFWTDLFEAWNNRKTLTRLARSKPPGLRLLEVGVGSGSFLNPARSAGYDVMGCDLSAPICSRINSVYGIPMFSEPLASLAGTNRFDVIVMNHVLEHVNQPIDFLRDVRRLLAPEGIAHIAIPNIACWEAMLSGWTSFEPYHLVYFTPQTLTRTISAASGLAIVRMTTPDSFSGWFLAILRTLMGVNRADGAVTRSAAASARYAGRSGVVEHAYRLVMVYSGLVTWPLRFVQGRLGKGDEIVCIARHRYLGLA
jgi:2-polyprenyl-3-methyl-5-hydroxy-6-metoxy-1,4-benzoquinol methylase